MCFGEGGRGAVEKPTYYGNVEKTDYETQSYYILCRVDAREILAILRPCWLVECKLIEPKIVLSLKLIHVCGRRE